MIIGRKKSISKWQKRKSSFKSLDKKTIDDDLITKPKNYKWKSYCKPTKGEQAIMDFLTDKNIKFVREKEFKDLINPFTKQKLRFDFYIGKLSTCIEFDGRQHFEVCSRFNMSKTDLYNSKARDGMKNDYCAIKKIRLIRISYKEINKIVEILTKELCL